MAGNPGTNVHPRRNRMSRRVVSRPHSPSTPDTRHLSFWPTPCCHPTMVDANPHLRSLSPQDWEFLFRETLLFAHYQVQRLRWRGSYGGIMPDGFDPNSLAAQAFLDLLSTIHYPQSTIPNSNGALSFQLNSP